MKKRLVVLGVSVCLIFAGCRTKRDIGPDAVTTKCMTVVDSTYGYTIYRHDETGVHYFSRDGAYGRAVCVMVNQDGTPYVGD